ncbi:MAG: MFS transporter, partial [Streptosporangiaceae bacterium]
LLLLGVPAAWLLPRPGPDGHRAARGSVRSDLRAGFGAIAGVRPLLRITATSVIAYVGVGMLVVACPLLGQRHLGGADRGALLLSLLAAASLAANAALARWPPRRSPDTLFALATGLAGLAYLGLALAPAAGWVIAAVALAGVADGPQLTAVFAVRHREAPARLRAQVFTTAASLKIAAGALGAVLAGHLAGSPAVVLAAAAVTQAVALAAFAVLGRTGKWLAIRPAAKYRRSRDGAVGQCGSPAAQSVGRHPVDGDRQAPRRGPGRRHGAGAHGRRHSRPGRGPGL